MSDCSVFTYPCLYASIIVPVYNEEENLSELYIELARAMRSIDDEGKAWEVLFIDDGSTDNSLGILRSIAKDHAPARFVSFAQNRGQSMAFAAGFQEMRGERAVTLDADLQNDPADIPAMLRLFDQGYDVVAGFRLKRRDVFAKRIASKIANKIRNWLSHETIRDTGCSLKVMRASILRNIPIYKGMHRFFPTLMRLYGAQKVAEMPVNHRPRMHGQSKYGVWDRAFSAFYDLLAVRWMISRHSSYEISERSDN